MNTEEKNNNKNKEKEVKLPFCEGTHTAEHSRLWEDDEPCDCGIRGRI